MINSDDAFFESFSSAAQMPDQVSSRLKARLYSALIAEQQETGPLRSLPETNRRGGALCVFEKLVQIAPLPSGAKESFICWNCHARVLAERVEHAPVWWPNCPYSHFQEN